MVQSIIDFNELHVLKDKKILSLVNLDEFPYSEMSWRGWIEQRLRDLHKPRVRRS